MKKYISIYLFALVFASCNGSTTKNDTADSTSKTAVSKADLPVISFPLDTYDFGSINQGEKVAHDFKFTNTGKSPLIIADAQASCGCTIPAFPHKPIAPGEEGIIKVIFNSQGKSGKQNKVVTITSNAATPLTTVALIGDVKEPKK